MLVRQSTIVSYALAHTGVHTDITIDNEKTSVVIEADPLDGNRTVFVVTHLSDVSENIRKVLVQLSKGKLPVEAKALNTLSVSVQPGERLNHNVPSVELLPNEFQDFSLSMLKKLGSTAQKTYRFMRWRYNIAGKHSPFSSRPPEFSIDGETWHALPIGMNVEVSMVPQIHLERYDYKEIQAFVDKDINEEPLAHEIILEATQLYVERNYRSSLIMTVTGLELAVKHHLALIIPEAEWLVTEMPMPPVLRLLTEYIPKLSLPNGYRQFPVLPETTVRSIKALINKRNSLVHSASRTTLEANFIIESLDIVRDISWLLVYCQGNDWAEEYISQDLRDCLKWKS